MIITYIRSSSAFGQWKTCQQSYYIDYVLGHKFPANLKADLGTVCHKVFETLANINFALKQDKNASSIVDEDIGTINFSEKIFLEEDRLSDAEVAKINSQRTNKDIYKWDCSLKNGHVRYGTRLVEDIFERSFAYYMSRRSDWKPIDKRNALHWTWIGLDFNNGQYDPRRRNVIGTETHFDYELDFPWAEYETILPDGSKTTNKLRIKGTIDFTTRINNGIEVIDWKSGQRKDWSTGEEKTYEKLCEDEQLMFYHYALRRMYPNEKNIIMTIFFLRDGGPFSICFDDSHVQLMEDKIKKRFEEIKNTRYPKLRDPTQQDFMCKRLCPFFKNKFHKDDSDNMCKTVHNTLHKHGLEYTSHLYTHPDHNIDKYHAPGT